MPNTVQLTKNGQPVFPLTDASVVTGIAEVAKTGDYDDLDNKPTIPAAQIQSDWDQTDTGAKDFIKNKPTIPSPVTVDQTYDGTSSNAQSGVAMAGVLATKQDVIDSSHKLSYNLISGTPTIPEISTNIDTDAASDTKAASPKAVKTYVDNHRTNVSAVTSQQDGTIVITLTNGDTITVDLNHNHAEYYSKAAESTQPAGGFLPDVVYTLGTLTGAVTFSLAASVSGNINHYYWTFVAGSTAPTITWPSSNFSWSDGVGPTIAAGKYYEVSVLNGIAMFLEV